MHAHHRVGEQFVHGLYQTLVLRPLVVGEVGVLLAEAMVIVYEVYGAERPVCLYLAYHPADAVAVGGVVLRCHRHHVVAHGEELAGLLRYIPSHTLVHDGHQVLGFHPRVFLRFLESVRHLVFREQHHRIRPCVSVLGCLQHGLSRRLVLRARVGEIVHVEFTIPVGNHRLMVVCRPLLGAHSLDVVHSHCGRQPSVVACWQRNLLACVVYGKCVVFYKVVHQLLRCHEHRAVLVAIGEGNRPRLVLEMLEVLRALCAVDELAVPVIVYIPPSVHVCR